MTRTVEWSATIEVSGTMELDLLEDYETDVEQEIYDNLTVDSATERVYKFVEDKLIEKTREVEEELKSGK